MSNVAICYISIALNINCNSVKGFRDTITIKIANSKQSGTI